MITLDYQAASHCEQSPNTFLFLSLPLFSSLFPSFQTRETNYTPMNIRTGTNIHASCPDVQQSSFTIVRNILMHQPQRVQLLQTVCLGKNPSSVTWAASRGCRKVQHSTSISGVISACGILVFIHCRFIRICCLIQNTPRFN